MKDGDYRARHLVWDGDQLRLGPKGRILATVVPDAQWPNMWRVRLQGSTQLSDMVNRARAKDAAACLALAELNARKAA